MRQLHTVHKGAMWRGALPNDERGLTLVEVMVAMTLGLLILLALTVTFANTSGNQSEQEQTTRQLENARYTLDVLVEDVQHAGYYGEINPDLLGPTFSDPNPCTTTMNALGWNATAATPALTLPPGIKGVDGSATLACLSDRIDGTEAITIRHADTSPAIARAAIVAGNLYLQTSRCAQDIGQIVASSSSSDFTLRNLACTAPIESLRRYVSRTYYIASCNECAPSDGIPTLKRVELVNGELRTTSMAEGVENVHIEYGIDINSDGIPDEFVTTSEVDGDPVTHDWQNVVSLRLHILARNTQATPGYTDPRTYILGNLTITPNDAFKRTLLSTTVRLNNVGGRRDM